MIRAARRTVFSIIVLGSLVPFSLAGFTPAMAQGVDLSTLPRVAAAKVVYAGPTSTIYTTSGSVEQTAEAVSKPRPGLPPPDGASKLRWPRMVMFSVSCRNVVGAI